MRRKSLERLAGVGGRDARAAAVLAGERQFLLECHGLIGKSVRRNIDEAGDDRLTPKPQILPGGGLPARAPSWLAIWLPPL